MHRDSSSRLSSIRLASGVLATLALLWSPVAAAQGIGSSSESGASTESEEAAEAPAPADTAEESEGEEGAPASADAEGGVSKEATVGQETVEEEVDERYVTDNINLDGAVGFHRIAAAQLGAPMTFHAGFLGEFFSADDTVRTNDTNSRTAGRILLQGTILEYFAFNLGLMARSNVNSFGQPEAMLTLGDANLGLTGAYPVTDYLTLGGDVGVFVPASFGESGLVGSGTSVRPRLLASLDTAPLTDGKVPIEAHFNIGYRFDNSENAIPEGTEVTRVERFAYDLNAYDSVEIGVGAEYDLPYVKPFVGFWMGLPVNGTDGICDTEVPLPCAADAGVGAAAPKFLSVGVKAEPIASLGLHAGVDFGLTTQDAKGLPVTPPYNVIFGLSWTIDPRPKVEYVEIEKVVEKQVAGEAKEGYLLGTVVDASNQKTVKGATIEYVGKDVSSQISSEINGKFRSYGFEPGTELTLRVNHPDFKPTEVDAVVKEGEVPLSVEMEPLPRMAEVTGRVFNDEDKPVKTARVYFVGNGINKSVPVDAAGNFAKELEAADYSVRVEAEGYLTTGRDISLEANDKLTLDLVLLPEPEKSVVVLRAEKIEIQEKIYFETGEAELLPRSFNVLNQVAALMLENPQVRKVRIEGHTDDRGEDDFNLDLSQRRAESVRTYLMDRGISSERLEAKGYGASRPILPNTSNRNRELNRRVEFTIIDQTKEGEEGAGTE